MKVNCDKAIAITNVRLLLINFINSVHSTCIMSTVTCVNVYDDYDI